MFAVGISRSFFVVSAPERDTQTVLDLAPFFETKPVPKRMTFVAGTAMVAALACMSFADRAEAAGACGDVSEQGSVICDDSGNPFADGIAYEAQPPAADPASDLLDLDMLVRSGVAIVMPAGGNAAPAIDLSATDAASVSLYAEEGAVVVTEGVDQTGLKIRTANGDITAITPDIVTAGSSARGIDLETSNGAIDLLARSVTTYGDDARAIDARALNGGDVTVIAEGPIATYGDRSAAVAAGARITPNSGSGSVTVSVGDISTWGDGSDGLIARGADVAMALNGDIVTRGQNSYGAYVRSAQGDASIGAFGTIETFGLGSVGIDVYGAGDVAVVGGGSVVTHGALSTGVSARSDAGNVVIDLASVHATSEDYSGSFGVIASTGTGDALIRIIDASTAAGSVRTVSASSAFGDAAIVATGLIAATGERAVAVDASATNGNAAVAVQDVVVTGYRATAIDVEGYSAGVLIDGTVSAQGGGNGSDFAVRVRGERPYIPGSVAIGPDGEYIYTDGSFADTGGDIAIVNNGTVEASGGGVGGISAYTRGAVTISGNGNVFTQGDEAKAIQILAGADVTVDLNDVATSGDFSTALEIETPTVATVTVGSITTEGAGSHGITIAGRTETYNLPGYYVGDLYYDGEQISIPKPATAADIQVGSVTTSGASSSGITAYVLGDVAIAAGSVTTAGTRANGITTRSGGDASILVDTLSTKGRRADGIFASALGEVAVGVGSASTTGDRATAIRTVSAGDATVILGELASSGNTATGIDVTTAGVANVALGTATLDGDYSTGISISASGGANVVAGDISATGYYATGISVATFGDATVALRSADISGTYASAIDVTADGDATVYAGQLAVEGYRADGILVTTGGAANVGVQSASISGAYGNAIDVTAAGDVGIVASRLAAEGESAQAILVSSGGRTAIGLESGNATGDYSGVISVESAGDVDILAGQLSATGNYAGGVYVYNGGMATVAVNAVSVQGESSSAIDVTAASGAAIVAGQVSAEGDYAGGVIVSTYGPASIALNSVSVSGRESQGISIASGADAYVGVGSIIAEGADSVGLTLQTAGAADILVGAATVSGDGASAIDIMAGQDVELIVGDLTVSGDGARGVNVLSGGAASVTVLGTVIGSADQLRGPDVPAGPGGRIQDPASAIISVQAADAAAVYLDGSITTTGTLEGGIAVRSPGGALVSGTGSVSTSGDGATGIYAGATQGNVVISTGTVSTQGDNANAVHARSYVRAYADVASIKTSGDGSIGLLVEAGEVAAAMAGSIATSGAAAHGLVSHSYGAAYGAAQSITVTGAGALGMDVSSYAQGNATAIAGTVHVADGRGIGAFAANGMASITVEQLVQASDTGVGPGLAASGATGASITFGSVQSSGDGNTSAVAASSTSGDILIQGGTIIASGDRRNGVLATGMSADISIAISGTITTDGAGATGIYAATGGAVDIAANRVVTNATRYASIETQGASVTLRANRVEARGDNETDGPLAAVMASGATFADVTVGTVLATGTGRDGVAIASYGTGALTIVAGGTVSATHDAVTFQTGQGASLINAGTISGGTGAAVRATGAPITIVNSGAISGALALTDGNDRVTNSGTLRLTDGTSFGAGDDRLVNSGALLLAGDVGFGAGSDAIVNSGTLRLAPNAATGLSALAAAPVSRNVAGLESFANSGRIDLRNGTAGDVLTLSGAFTGSGASTLGLDLAYGTTIIADKLVIGGAATGSTTVEFDISGTQELGRTPTLIQAGAGTSATAFTLAANQVSSGLFQRGLVFDTATNGFALAIAPSTAAYRLLNIGETAQSLWIESADSVAAHLSANHDAGVTGSGFWMSAVGGVAKRDEAGIFNAFGFDQAANIGYKQDVFGSQLGVDIGNGNIGFGLTGGYASSIVSFTGSVDRVSFDAWNLGAYASFSSGILFANALAKYDFYNIDVKLASAGANGKKIDGNAYGARGEIGLSLGSDAFHIEPVASISWQHVSIDPLDLPLTVDFDDLEGGRASAGLRLRSTRDIGGGAKLNLYAQGDYVQPFGGKAAVTFSTMTTGVSFDDDRIGAYGKGRVGLSITQGRITGFIEGDTRFSSDYRSGGGKVGLRIGF
ncbi:MAG: hypothetical protein C0494_06480 [Sphingobium sp.]|nr:hypothetical protein [Sphingobium sp.]